MLASVAEGADGRLPEEISWTPNKIAGQRLRSIRGFPNQYISREIPPTATALLL